MGNSTGKLTALRRWRPSTDQCETLNCVPLDFLKGITADFSKDQELGCGVFGVVYKGVLQNGKAIAVKRLFHTNLDDDQFQKGVTELFWLKHRNIVKLVCYCAESQWKPEIDGTYVMAEVRNMLLCSEYANNKSLDLHISSIPTAEPYGLWWHMRYEIITGICRGLLYLHVECQIAHMDLKPQNILLDDNMEPKIADIGMFRLFGWQKSQIMVQQTLGYMAPEYIANGLISEKADIFSLGVIIIELMTGCRDYPSTEESCEHFVENVVGSWRKSLEEAGRRYDRPLEYYLQQVKTCILMGLMCVDAEPNKRPTARDILEKLTEADVTNMNEEPKPLVRFDVGFTPDLEDLLRADAEVLGERTYGTVYKATLENGIIVAVRRFRPEMTKDKKDFKAKVMVLGTIRHPNLLAPVACLVKRDHKLIIIGYMPRGSLSAFLHGYS